MKQNFIALCAGTLFSVGLSVSGMTDTHNILAFLDIFGDWRPELLLVMASGITVTTIGYQWIFTRKAPLFAPAFQLPQHKQVDRSLIIGATLFGIGWGIYGYCPGPAIASLSYGYIQTWLFLSALLAGIYGHKAFQQRRSTDA